MSLLGKVFNVRSVEHEQVNLAAVNQICVIHGAMNGCKEIRNSLKDCFKNVFLYTYAKVTLLWASFHKVTNIICNSLVACCS